MNATRSTTKARLSHRLAVHLRVERSFDEAQTNNGWLIFRGIEAAYRRQIPALSVAEALLCAGA
jgi:hypothetical protein